MPVVKYCIKSPVMLEKAYYPAVRKAILMFMVKKYPNCLGVKVSFVNYAVVL